MSNYDRDREERKLERQLILYAALFAAFMVYLAVMALRATFGG